MPTWSLQLLHAIVSISRRLSLWFPLTMFQRKKSFYVIAFPEFYLSWFLERFRAGRTVLCSRIKRRCVAGRGIARERRAGRRMVFVWLAAFFLLVFLLVLIVIQLMSLVDLEFDYINPYDSASQINKVIFPEFALQGAACLLFLLSGHWLMFLFCVPNLYYNFRLFQRGQHLIDVTEIFNQLNREKKKRFVKLISTVILILISLFWVFADGPRQASWNKK